MIEAGTKKKRPCEFREGVAGEREGFAEKVAVKLGLECLSVTNKQK